MELLLRPDHGILRRGLVRDCGSGNLFPMIETFFRLHHGFKLLELANMDNPILKDVILRRWDLSHSIIVGSLAEAASKSIAANPLLARVSAYYH